MAVRMPITYLATAGAGLTTRERLFVCFAWTPKATVQVGVGRESTERKAVLGRITALCASA